MPYVVIGIGFLLFLMFISKQEEKKKLLFMKNWLEDNFGEIPDQEYTSESLEALKGYYNLRKVKQGDIDDITFHDLDMNRIFMLLNNTQSSVGEEYLYYLLRQLCFDQDTLTERNSLMKFFSSHKEERIKFQLAMSKLGKLPNVSVYSYMNQMKELTEYSTVQHYFCAISIFVAIGILLIEPRFGILAICLVIVNNIIQYYKKKADNESYLKTLAFIVRLLRSVDNLNAIDAPFLRPYIDKIVMDSKKFRYVKRNAKWISSGSAMGGSLLDSILDYVRMLFHIDLIKFSKMIRVINRYQGELDEIYTTIGFLESMCAAASFRSHVEYYCEPKLMKSKQVVLDAVDVYHPLLKEPVANSLKEMKSVLITGSNASGKSTFIKTLAINAILSQTIYTSLSRKYTANYYEVYTSMALKDDIFNSESYYMVEIKSLKRILDAVNQDIPILCFVDEVLRGTNTLERIAASSQILRSLSKGYVMCFAATHDIELTYILERYFSNYHFKEEVINNDVLFDYMLGKGRAQSRNAIKLLRMIGYSEEIIEQATKAANDFLLHGVWENL